LNPREAFLLSRIDGTVNENDLSSLTGFDAATVSACIDRLAALGVIEIAGGRTDEQRVSHAQLGQQKAPGTDSPRVSHTQFRSPVQSPEMDEVVDLDTDRKRRVLELHPKLAELDYYALLGVADAAEKKDIKRAYYAAAPNYHPDKFYGKKLG